MKIFEIFIKISATIYLNVIIIFDQGEANTQWYLFNDFQISAINKEEAVDFDLKWKVPCILYYQRVDLDER